MSFYTRWTIGATLLGLSSCAAVVPHTLQTPWVSRRAESEVALNTGLHGTDLQAAHGLSNQVTLLASAHQRVRSNRGHWAYAGELGAGYSWARPSQQTWSLYGGLGYGTGKSGGSFCPDLCDLSIADRIRYGYAFVQPTYRWMPDPAFGVSAAVRIEALDFLRWEETTTYLDQLADPTMPGRASKVVTRTGIGALAVQPGVNMFVALSRHFRLNFNSSIFIPLQRDFPSVMPFAVGLGVQYHFGGAAVAETP